jgi:hypothetical protein
MNRSGPRHDGLAIAEALAAARRRSRERMWESSARMALRRGSLKAGEELAARTARGQTSSFLTTTRAKEGT